jgi:hypothetical protein
MNNIKKLSIANFLGFVVTVIVNGLANALPINGRTTGELSDMYPNLLGQLVSHFQFGKLFICFY